MPSIKYIRIEGEAVSAIEEIVHRHTSLPEWLAAIQKLTPQTLATPMFFEGTVLYAQKGEQQLVVINQPAAVKKVIWRTTILRDLAEPARTRWQLAIPHHMFLLTFNKEGAVGSSHIFYTQKPLTSEKDMLFRTNLANVHSYLAQNGIPSHICAGDIRMDIKLLFAQKCQMFINNFWATEFNDDIPPLLRGRESDRVFTAAAPPAKLNNLNEWDKASTETPNFLAEMDWPFAPICSLETILNEKWQVR